MAMTSSAPQMMTSLNNIPIPMAVSVTSGGTDDDLPGSSINLPLTPIPPPTIKEELEEEDSLEEDDDLEGEEEDEEGEDQDEAIGLIIKPVIENILSSPSSSGEEGEEEAEEGCGSIQGGGASLDEEEESVSEFEEEFPPTNGPSSTSANFYFNPSSSTPTPPATRGPRRSGGGAGVYNNSNKFLLLDSAGTPFISSSSSSPSRGGGGGRKKREAFTLQQKLQVLQFLETHSVNATSRYYKVDPKSIRLWRSQKHKIQQTVQEELLSLEQGGEVDGVTPRKRISGAGRKKRNKPVIVEIEENPCKRVRRTIKLSDKVEIIRLIEHGQTQSDVARSLGISQSTVQTIWSNKGDILERNSSPRKKRRNLHWKKYSSIDSALFNWVRQCREAGVTLDTKLLHDKAVEYSEYYKQAEFKGQASRWVDVFKRRHSLSELDRQDRLQLGAGSLSSSSPSPLLGVGVGIGLEQHTLGQMGQLTPASNHNNHAHQTPSSSCSSLLPQSTLQQNPHQHLDFVPDFDLSSFPGLIAGLYPTDPVNSTHQNSQSQPHTSAQPVSSGPPPPPTFPIPSFNSHLPVISVSGGPVTTCDAMKYVELIRNWISSSGLGGETEELLNNHLNAIENAVLKRRMTEMMANPSSSSSINTNSQDMRR